MSQYKKFQVRGIIGGKRFCTDFLKKTPWEEEAPLRGTLYQVELSKNYPYEKSSF